MQNAKNNRSKRKKRKMQMMAKGKILIKPSFKKKNKNKKKQNPTVKWERKKKKKVFSIATHDIAYHVIFPLPNSQIKKKTTGLVCANESSRCFLHSQ